MSGEPDWTVELIGEDGKPGLLALVAPLQWLRPPEELERTAESLAALLGQGAGPKELADTVEWLRALALLGRDCIEAIEALGLRWSWTDRAIVGPAGDGPGRPRSSHSLAVAAAWEQLGGRALAEWYGAETLAAVRERLRGLVPDSELEDDKLRSRIQRHAAEAERR